MSHRTKQTESFRLGLVPRIQMVAGLAILGVVVLMLIALGMLRAAHIGAEQAMLRGRVEQAMAVAQDFAARATAGEISASAARGQALRVIGDLHDETGGSAVWLAGEGGFMLGADGQPGPALALVAARPGEPSFVDITLPASELRPRALRRSAYVAEFPAWGWTIGAEGEAPPPLIDAHRGAPVMLAGIVLIELIFLASWRATCLVAPLQSTLAAMRRMALGELDVGLPSIRSAPEIEALVAATARLRDTTLARASLAENPYRRVDSSTRRQRALTELTRDLAAEPMLPRARAETVD